MLLVSPVQSDVKPGQLFCNVHSEPLSWSLLRIALRGPHVLDIFPVLSKCDPSWESHLRMLFDWHHGVRAKVLSTPYHDHDRSIQRYDCVSLTPQLTKYIVNKVSRNILSVIISRLCTYSLCIAHSIKYFSLPSRLLSLTSDRRLLVRDIKSHVSDMR